MTDTMTLEQLHRCMSQIHSKGTKPKIKVRKWLWTHGYRYRLNVKSVLGKPDIVMRPYRTAIISSPSQKKCRLHPPLRQNNCIFAPLIRQNFC